jgi:2-dehydropantoate 2-reductase
VNSVSRIGIVGSGAIGSYYGARLALAGADVRFLMRNDLAHVRANGITLCERDGVRRLENVKAFATTAEIGTVDVVLITLKATSNSALSELLPPLIGPDTLVVTLQNGLGNEEYVSSIVGPARVLGGLCFIGVNREAAGQLVGFHTPGAVTLGEFNRPAADRTRALAALFQSAGVNARAVDNLAEARWRKLVWNIPFNGLAIAGGGITTDKILSDSALAREARILMEEVAAAAAALGCEIPEAFIQQQIDVTLPMGPYKPSSLVDFLAGREVEIEPIWGEPLRRAQAAGVSVPHLEALYAKLKMLTGTAGL